MQTLGDVLALVIKVNASLELFGYSPDWLGEFQTRCREIGRAVCREQGVDSIEALALANVPLGAESGELTRELQNFVNQRK